MSDSPVTSVERLTTPWQTADPFLFCMHHHDRYPAANEQMGPDASLEGRTLGNDFSGKDGWSMYHGEVVPGFPRHPHRGFETITICRQGFIDHSDSLGATARFGQGDVQWMTAGNGIVHAEAFPLLDTEGPNPTELFQIWLNLPAEDKKKDPYFTMFWHEDIPTRRFADREGRQTELTVIAGSIEQVDPLEPPPSSWASRGESEVGVWTLEMEPGAQWELPAASGQANRSLYVFEGEGVEIGGRRVANERAVEVRSDVACAITAGETRSEVLVLQGRPIGEPVARHGPFVMNHQGEIRQAMLDYQRTQFGGWPWQQDAPVHARERGRFAIHAGGREEQP
jgi:hypothetical protein